MRKTRSQILAWESKWSVPIGAVTFLGVAVLIASAFVISSVNGSGDAELLQKASEHSSDVSLSAALEAIGFVILVAPLYFLFRAASARSDRMRRQLVGLVIAAPLFFAVSAGFNAAATNEAADQFTAGQARSTLSGKPAPECKTELKDKGAKGFGEEHEAAGESPTQDCVNTKVHDNEATNALDDAGTAPSRPGSASPAALASPSSSSRCLYAMRTGLLSRFWGSLGMALGVAALLLLVQFTLIFFIYFGLLLIGKLPGGRPPAWAAGEAIPWPTPGQKAAADDSNPRTPTDRGRRRRGDPAATKATARRWAERRKRKRRASPAGLRPGGPSACSAAAAPRLRWVRISLMIRSRRGSAEVSTWLIAAATPGWTAAIRSCIAWATAR